MSRKHAGPHIALIGAVLAVAALAQDDRIESRTQTAARESTPIPAEGFWPTRLMMKRIFERIADEMATEYSMDDEQRDRTAQIFQERLVPFLEENRGEIQTLMNEFMEGQLHNEAPSIEAVANWSQRVLPLLQKVDGVVDNIADGMREYFTDDQVSRLEGNVAAAKTALGIATNKIGSWAAGHYDPETEWTSPGPERRKREEAERVKNEELMREAEAAARAKADEASEARALAEQALADEAARAADTRAANVRPLRPNRATSTSAPVITDEWHLYTEDFCRRYDFEPEQRQKAMEMLRTRQVERDAYLLKKSAEIERVTRKAAAAVEEEDKKAAKAEGDRINAPVERMFQQLKDKLNTLPTRAQRNRALESSTSAPSSSVVEPLRP